MGKNHLLKILIFVGIGIAAYQQSIYCNVIWPGMLIAIGIFATLPLALISVAVEAILFYHLLKNISIYRAFFVSFVGNVASTLLGTAITALAAPLPHILLSLFLFDKIPIFVNVLGVIIELIVMFLGSCFIELITIKKIFGYPTKDLWGPVLIGNFLTYLLAALYWLLYAYYFKSSLTPITLG